MVLVWMACLTTDLQLHERSFHHRANCIYFFKYFLCFEHSVCCSSVSFRGLQLTGGAVHLPKMFSSEKSSPAAWRVALTRPLSRADSVPTSPARSELDQKKKKRKDRNSPSWSDRPRQSEQAAAQKQQTLSAGRSEDRVRAFVHMFKEHRVHQYADP